MAQFEQLMASNKRNSALLVVLFVLFICVLGGVLGWALLGDWRMAVPSIALALVVSTVGALVGYYAGSSAVLALSGAKEIAKQDDPQLYNVVEELSIAAGLPMPALYVIETDSLNAFATGRDPQHAAVAVTRGLRERLGRDELQGVLAHELSHVKNFDTRFMTLMAVLVGVVVLVADIGMRSMFYGRRRSSSDRGGGGGGIMIIVALAAILLAILAPIFAKLIQLAVSRQREYLADASAARLTRYPDGLARALEVLAADEAALPTASRATAHLFIVEPLMANGRRAGGHGMWSSHPPIEERIARLRTLGSMTAAE